MRIPRVFQNIPLKINETIMLDERASHYVGQVLRLTINAPLVLFNGTGGQYEAVIQQIHKKKIMVEIKTFNDDHKESPLTICLLQGMAKREKMDVIVQKSVELGVTKIIPIITTRVNTRLDAAKAQKRLAHWQGIIVSACEQCGRNILPTISLPNSLEEVLPTLSKCLNLMLDPYATNTLHDLVSVQEVNLLIGPEGGLTPKEIAMAGENNFMAIYFGSRILRTETAALAGITALQYQFGDL